MAESFFAKRILTIFSMMQDEPEIVISPLSGPITEDGISVIVEIYRMSNRKGWTLEVIDHDAGTTVWETVFDTDEQAHGVFKQALKTEGIRSFAEAPKSNSLQFRLHT